MQCLDILSKQSETAGFRSVIADVMHDVEAGSTLSESLGRRPTVFDSLFVNMVDAGEAGGILDDILGRLATYLEKAEALKRKVKSAMTYPTVVLTVAVGATIFMLLFIIPTFATYLRRLRRGAAPSHEDRHERFELPEGVLVGCSPG